VFPFHPGSPRGTNVSGILTGRRSLLQQAFVLAVVAALAVVVPSPQARALERPHRVASLNLCADQLLLALADRDQIASLTPLVRDRSISFLADRAGDLPVESQAEALLFRNVDLVLVGRFGTALKQSLLQRHGVAVMVLDVWQNLASGRDEIRAMAARLGHPERGEALIGQIDAALARSRGIVRGRPSILTYYRRGWVPAADSLVGEVLRQMGFVLHQESLGLREGGVARLESVVASPPDYALMDEAAGHSVDNGSALLVHPALIAAIPPERRLVLPGPLEICGGPATPAAIDALAAEVRRKVK
jgi:iron complex transport system substrate-binding protein